MKSSREYITCSGGISEKKWHPHIVEEDAQCGKTRKLPEKIFRENNSLVALSPHDIFVKKV